MKARAVRIPLAHARVTFHGREASLINISRTGALLRVADAPEAGSEGNLTVSHAHTTVHIEGHVVRASLAAPDAESGASEPAWEAGIRFTSPPPEEITALLRRVVAAPRSAEQG